MRSETRKYICAELLNYQRSQNELQRVREQLEYIRAYPAFSVHGCVVNIAKFSTYQFFHFLPPVVVAKNATTTINAHFLRVVNLLTVHIRSH